MMASSDSKKKKKGKKKDRKTETRAKTKAKRPGASKGGDHMPPLSCFFFITCFTLIPHGTLALLHTYLLDQFEQILKESFQFFVLDRTIHVLHLIRKDYFIFSFFSLYKFLRNYWMMNVWYVQFYVCVCVFAQFSSHQLIIHSLW